MSAPLPRTSRGALAALLCSPLLFACVTHHHHPPAKRTVTHTRAHEPGPPPHAPAHGYRHKHRDRVGGPVVELRYDDALRIYVVVGHADHYFHAGRYYRRHDGRWVASTQLAGPWAVVEIAKLPPGLRAKHKSAKQKTPGSWKPAPPAKHKNKRW